MTLAAGHLICFGGFHAMFKIRIIHYILYVILTTRVSIFKLERVYICAFPTADAVVTSEVICYIVQAGEIIYL